MITTPYKNKKALIFLKKLDSNYKVLDLILSDFERYMQIVKEQINIRNINTQEKEIFPVVFEGSYNHKENIEMRLDLIYFFCNDLEDSKIELKSENLELLWNLFVTNANSESEKIILYKFLGNRASESRYLFLFLFIFLLLYLIFNINYVNLFLF